MADADRVIDLPVPAAWTARVRDGWGNAMLCVWPDTPDQVATVPPPESDTVIVAGDGETFTEIRTLPQNLPLAEATVIMRVTGPAGTDAGATGAGAGAGACG